MAVYIRGVNLAEIFSPARSANLFCSARPGSELIYYKICTMIFNTPYILGGRQKLMKILLSTDIICDL